MIRYALICAHQHEFESWFSDSAAYDRLSAAGEVVCPICGDRHVRKAIMAPTIARTRSEPVEAKPAGIAGKGKAVAANLSDDMRQKLVALRREIEKTHDYVGDQFADEARRMHSGEIEERGIYGDATREEAQELIEEGVDIAPLPFASRLDA
ncbi:MAG: DUF1178 family protein [Pseudomonadota bacterium]